MSEETEKIIEESKKAAKDLAEYKKNLREIFNHIPETDKIKAPNTLKVDKGYTPLIIKPNWNDFNFRYWEYGDTNDFWLVRIESTTQEIQTAYSFWLKKLGSIEVKASNPTKTKYPDLPEKEMFSLTGYRKNWFIVDNDYYELAHKKTEEFFRSKELKKDKSIKAKEQANKIFAEKPKEEIKTEFIEEPESEWEQKHAKGFVVPKDVYNPQSTIKDINKDGEYEIEAGKVKILNDTALVKSENSSKDRMLPELVLNAENIKKFVYRGKIPITDQEVVMFLALCHKQNLDPFKRDVYLVKYSVEQPAQMIVSKDLFLKRANECKDYIGLDAGIIVEDKDGNETFREGSRVKKEETLVGGYAKVEIKDKRHSYAEVSFEEYFKARNPSWKNIPATMIRKVAIVQSLREGFPDEFQGMYDDAEMIQARSDEEVS